ncbi:methyl-accepting chemotaxis protein [Pseudodesulfovibrio tunisiensis]|uniref:methyl-accepting chemotaxis protein n=1 Tax=Pseudodesulfovibrio tunisiensis TaxID=463192 RepID=UPI001FB47725
MQADIETGLDVTRTLAATFEAMAAEQGGWSREAANRILRRTLASNRKFFSIQATFDGSVMTRGERSGGEYALEFVRGDARSAARNLSGYRDQEWYRVPMQTQGPVLTEPYRDRTLGTTQATVAAPVTVQGRVVGVVGINFDLGSLENMVADIRPYETGYAFLASARGEIVSHPRKERIGKSVAEFFDREIGAAILDNVSKGKGSEQFERKSGIYYRFQPVHVDGLSSVWSIAVAMPRAKIVAAADRTMFMSIGLGLCGLILLVVVVVFTVRSLCVPLKRTMQFAQHVARGEFDTTLDVHRGDELGILADALRNMVDSLETMVETAREKTEEAEQQTEAAQKATERAEQARKEAENARREGRLHAAQQLEVIVEQVSSASTELSVQVEQASHGAEDQTRMTSEAATAMSQMGTAILEVAQNAGSAANSAENSREQAWQGQKIVSELAQSIGAVRTHARTMTEDLNMLGDKASNIGRIMGVISDIADQTNLLALNAAIEAARAGDAGRGFAVVADEVRKLAEKTMVATNEVGEAVRDIQDGTQLSIHAMESTAEAVVGSTTMADKAGAALASIVDLAEENESEVRAIATASEEQSAAGEQINVSVQEVSEVSRETAQAMNESATALADLARRAHDLERIIAELKQ